MPRFTVHDGGQWGDDLSARQRAILDFFRDWLDRQGVPPTYREIGQVMGKSAMRDLLRDLALSEDARFAKLSSRCRTCSSSPV